MSGWIKLHRTIQRWGWRSSPYHTSVFLDLLLEANHEDGEYLGTFIPKGSLTTSIKAISERTGVTQKRVRTILNHLKTTNEVAIKSTTKFTMISITKWNEYQLTGEEMGKQGANEGQTEGKRGATNKNANNNKKGKKKNLSVVADPENRELFKDLPIDTAPETNADELAVKVLTALNAICFKKFRCNDFNLGFVKTRIKDGYKYEDFVAVIKYKQAEWSKKPEMRGYLQPSTLFNGKFDQYLNQALDADKPLTDPLDDFFAQYMPERQEGA